MKNNKQTKQEKHNDDTYKNVQNMLQSRGHDDDIQGHANYTGDPYHSSDEGRAAWGGGDNMWLKQGKEESKSRDAASASSGAGAKAHRASTDTTTGRIIRHSLMGR